MSVSGSGSLTTCTRTSADGCGQAQRCRLATDQPIVVGHRRFHRGTAYDGDIAVADLEEPDPRWRQHREQQRAPVARSVDRRRAVLSARVAFLVGERSGANIVEHPFTPPLHDRFGQRSAEVSLERRLIGQRATNWSRMPAARCHRPPRRPSREPTSLRTYRSPPWPSQTAATSAAVGPFDLHHADSVLVRAFRSARATAPRTLAVTAAHRPAVVVTRSTPLVSRSRHPTSAPTEWTHRDEVRGHT